MGDYKNQKFEYYLIKLSTNELDQSFHEIQNAGEDGWELISVVLEQGLFNYFFKRHKKINKQFSAAFASDSEEID